jgi:transposase-like protein
MSQKRKTKEEIVAEYLTGNYTYRELGLKYDIPFRSICDWVLEYQGPAVLRVNLGIKFFWDI